jgi:hypothetical protein
MRQEFDLILDRVNWQDSGCELHSKCLECPLPVCAEELPRGRQRLRMKNRAKEMRSLRDQGKSVAEIAATFCVTDRTVRRALSRQ